jgi:hypothetical protein
MEMYFITLALAYNLYCEVPLSNDVRVKVTSAIERLTPDQRWMLSHRSYNAVYDVLWHGSKDNLENYQPSVSAPLARAHDQLCENIRHQIEGAAEKAIFAEQEETMTKPGHL